MPARTPLSTLLSHALVAFTIELDNEFERRFMESGGGARVVSLVMWSNFLRFVGNGITVGELPAAVGLPRPRALSRLGGMERWRYVAVGADGDGSVSETKREGYGSARGLPNDWVVRATPAGRRAAAIWPRLFAEMEARWEDRFGTEAVDALTSTLRAIVGRLDLDLPEYLPIVGSANGMAAELTPVERRDDDASRLPLAALLAQTLLAYTLDFEERSELSLPLSANLVRVLDETDVPVRDLPGAAGVSKEATAMALTYLTKAGYVSVEGASAGTRVARLTPKGRAAQEKYNSLHRQIERRWETRFGADDVRGLRSSLEQLLEQRESLSRGLQPHPGGWRNSKPYVERTETMLADPRRALPHYPMVLHRGGWPDGS